MSPPTTSHTGQNTNQELPSITPQEEEDGGTNIIENSTTSGIPKLQSKTLMSKILKKISISTNNVLLLSGTVGPIIAAILLMLYKEKYLSWFGGMYTLIIANNLRRNGYNDEMFKNLHDEETRSNIKFLSNQLFIIITTVIVLLMGKTFIEFLMK